MPVSSYNQEFKEQLVLEVIEASKPVAEVARSYGLAPQTVRNWVNKWRREHPDPGLEATSPDQIAETKRLKKELREARTGDRVPEKSCGLLRPGVPVAMKYAYIHSEEGSYPVSWMCRWSKVSRSGYYAWQNRGLSESEKRREELTVFITYSPRKTKTGCGLGSMKSVGICLCVLDFGVPCFIIES